jgi:bifunctional DNA-binding transcriptional regulator/antitoxin component of YhaV-PrlF toxin-antitoxin module
LEELIPVRIVKVTSNDTTPLIYLPADVQRALKIRKGDRLLLYIDRKRNRLIAQKVAEADQLSETIGNSGRRRRGG